jgi:hypothetical protein
MSTAGQALLGRYNTRGKRRAVRAGRIIAAIVTSCMIHPSRTCPITLYPANKNAFVHVGSTRTSHVYDARALASYIDATGDARSPITRESFLPIEMRRLRRLANGAPEHTPVVTATTTTATTHTDNGITGWLVSSATSITDDIVTVLSSWVHATTMWNIRIGFFMIVSTLLPTLREAINDIAMLDHGRAAIACTEGADAIRDVDLSQCQEAHIAFVTSARDACARRIREFVHEFIPPQQQEET